MIQVICVLVPIVCMSLVVPELKRLQQREYTFLLISVFVIYLIGNMYCTLWSRTPSETASIEIVPFSAYSRLFQESPVGGKRVSGMFASFMEGTLPITGLILNVFLYYPLGYLLPILFPKLKPKHVILIGCLCSIATEATQYLLKMGWCETDDVIHNTLGTAIGVWVWLWQSKRLKTVADQKSGQD